MSLNRLQKIISDSDLLSRRKADLLIKQGLLTSYRRQAILGEKADPRSNHISVESRDLSKNLNQKVFLLNKPYGVISSRQDNHERELIISLIPSHIHRGIQPVGRLVFDSRGAIILTNDVELTIRLTHPNYSHTKTYLVWASGQPSQTILDNLRTGILLNGKMTIPERIEVLDKVNRKTLLKVIQKEGLNRQIRRIETLLENSVQDLQRISISNINLNGLRDGKWRELNTKEWSSIVK